MIPMNYLYWMWKSDFIISSLNVKHLIIEIVEQVRSHTRGHRPGWLIVAHPPPLRGHADLRRPRLPYIRKSMRKGTSSRRLVLKKTRRSWHATTASMKTPLSGGSMDLHLRLMGVLPFIEMSTVLASVIPPMIKL